MDEPKTITQVCKMLDLTSRRIRYYEQLGLIKTVRNSKTAPRKLDSENIERLHRIKFLRKLGLSLEEIKEVIDSDKKAAEMISFKSNEIQAEINAQIDRIHILQEVLATVEKGGNIYSAEEKLNQSPDDTENMRVAAEVTNLFAENRFKDMIPYFNAENKKMTIDIVENIWKSHIEKCGKFISVCKQKMDGHEIINRLHYEKLDVIIKMNVCGGLVSTIFFQYYKEIE